LPAILVLNAILVGGLVLWWALARIGALPGFALGAVGFIGCWSLVSSALGAVLSGTVLPAALRSGVSARSLLLAAPWLVAVIDLRFAVMAGTSFVAWCLLAVLALCTWLTQASFALSPGGRDAVGTWRAALVRTGAGPMPALGMIALGALVAIVVTTWSAVAIAWLPGLWLAVSVTILREPAPMPDGAPVREP
jgi:hypothetical protein